MSATDVSTSAAAPLPETACNMKIEVITLPVSDVDRAKAFYGSLGWRLDLDLARGENFRAVQSVATSRSGIPTNLTPMESLSNVACR